MICYQAGANPANFCVTTYLYNLLEQKTLYLKGNSILEKGYTITALNGIDNAKQAISDIAKEGANQVKGAVNDVKNAVKDMFQNK